MKRYVFLGLIWLALIVIALGFILYRPRAGSEPRRVVATQALPENHLLQGGDFAVEGLHQRYLLRGVAAGGEVTADNVSTVPKLPANTVLINVPISSAALRAGSIAIGTDMRLCKSDGSEHAAGLKVLAVVCHPTAGCSALLAQPAPPAKPLTDIAAGVVASPAACR